MKSAEKVIDKELISHLLMLEEEQQDIVLAYIKVLLNEASEEDVDTRQKLIARAKASNESIAAGRTKSINQIRKEVKNW